jgi:hypothetical protein
MSGIIYLPNSPYVSDGNSSPQFTGSLIVASMTVLVGLAGDRVQPADPVKDLSAVAATL